MTPPIIALLVLICFAIFFLIRYQNRTTSIFGFVLLVTFAFGWVSSETLLSNAANTGLATLVILILVSNALEKTTILKRTTRMLFSGSEKFALIKVVGFSGVASALLNNTAVVATMINAMNKNKSIIASRLLLPMCFAATLGGTMTLIGTSTNLVVNSMWMKEGNPSIGFFDLTPIGLTIFIVCGCLLLFTSQLLPKKNPKVSDAQEYFLEAKVEPSSPLIGLTVESAGLRNLVDLFLVEIVRNKKIIAPVARYHEIQQGDKLIFSGDIKKIQTLNQFQGLSLFADHNGLPTQTLTEAVIKNDSSLVDKALKSTGFRAKFDAAVVAIRRDGGKLSGSLGEVVLRSGDVLLLATGPDFLGRNNISKNFFILSGLVPESVITGWREKVIILGFLIMIFSTVFVEISLFKSSLFFFALLLFTGSITVDDIKKNFPLEIWLIVVSALSLASAMSTVGLDEVIAKFAASSLQGYSPVFTLLGVMVFTTLITELLTNNAAAALMFPVGYSIALGLGISPYPIILGICFAASCSFISPFGYQTNLMVFNTGVYNIQDFARVGSLITVVFIMICAIMIPAVYPF